MWRHIRLNKLRTWHHCGVGETRFRNAASHILLLNGMLIQPGLPAVPVTLLKRRRGRTERITRNEKGEGGQRKTRLCGLSNGACPGQAVLVAGMLALKVHLVQV